MGKKKSGKKQEKPVVEEPVVQEEKEEEKEEETAAEEPVEKTEEEEKDTDEEEEEKKEKEAKPERSDKRKRLYALLCVALGTIEYVFMLMVVAILVLLFSQLIVVFVGFGLAGLRAVVTGALTHILSALWIRWRYAKRIPKDPKIKGRWCIVLPCTIFVILLDMALVIFLHWLNRIIHVGLVVPHDGPIVINPLDLVVRCIIAPICEEYVFRWALLVEARKLEGTSAAIPLQIQGAAGGLAFGLIHLGAAISANETPFVIIAHLIYAGCFGAAMTFLVGAAGNRMWPSVFCHIINNLVTLILPLNVAVTDWHGIAILVAATIIQSCLLVGLSFIPVKRPEQKEHEHSN